MCLCEQNVYSLLVRVPFETDLAEVTLATPLPTPRSPRIPPATCLEAVGRSFGARRREGESRAEPSAAGRGNGCCGCRVARPS